MSTKRVDIYEVRFEAPLFTGVSTCVAIDKKHAEKMTVRRLRKDWQLDVETITRMQTKRISVIGVVETKKFAHIAHLETRI